MKNHRLLHALWPFLALLTCLFPSAAVKTDSLSELGGKPFGNPSHIATMPAGWVEKPIVYAKSARGNEIVVTLDQHLYPALLPVIQRYAEQQGLKIDVSEGTCGISIGKLARKEVDIGGFCCPPGKTDRLPSLRFHTLGIAAVALLVHPTNPIHDITLEQARKIFAGEIYRWSELKTSRGKA